MHNMAGILNFLIKAYRKNEWSKVRSIHISDQKAHLGYKTPAIRKSSRFAAYDLSSMSLNKKEILPSFDPNVRRFRLSVVHHEEKDILAPAFPESVAEGDVRWNKKVGDSVATDEVVCEIETDKTSIPVPSPQNGVIVARYAEDGASVKAKQKLFRIKLGAATPAGTPAPTPKAGPSPPKATPPPAPAPKAVPAPPKATQPPAQAPKAVPSPPEATPPPKPTSPPKPLSSEEPQLPAPIPRPSTPMPSAPQQLTHAAFVKVPPSDPTREIVGTRTEHRVKMTKMRLRIAQRLKEAQNENAMLTTFNEIDMSTIIAFRKFHQEAFSKKYGVKLGFMSAFIKAATYALQDQPVVNAVIDGNDIVYRDYIDISVAVASPKGLVVPVIRNVTSMNFADIEKAIVQFGEKAKAGRLSIEDMDGGTFTISNGGVFGSLLGTPIINPPQSAILGMHATVERPVAVKGQIVIKPMMYVALTYDHRLIDGREAVLFLRKIKDGVENPIRIVAGI